jgi:hypothetical protein
MTVVQHDGRACQGRARELALLLVSMTLYGAECYPRTYGGVP